MGEVSVNQHDTLGTIVIPVFISLTCPGHLEDEYQLCKISTFYCTALETEAYDLLCNCEPDH